MKLRSVIAWCVLGAALAVGQATQPAELPRVVPWVELNAAGEPIYSEIVAGCRTFGTVTSTVCVSVGPYQVERLKGLRTEVPGLTLIPGIATNPVLDGRIDRRDGWQKVGVAVRRAVKICAPHVPVIIEMELAMADYLAGKYVPDWTLVQKGLAELPAEVTYWWYPGVFSADPTIQAREVEFLRCVTETLPHVVLVAPGWWGRTYPNDPNVQARQRINEALAPCINLVDCDPTWPEHWEIKVIPEITRECPLPLLLYSGRAAFRTAAEEVGRALHADVLARLAACGREQTALADYLQLAQRAVGDYQRRLRLAQPILYPEEQP